MTKTVGADSVRIESYVPSFSSMWQNPLVTANGYRLHDHIVSEYNGLLAMHLARKKAFNPEHIYFESQQNMTAGIGLSKSNERSIHNAINNLVETGYLRVVDHPTLKRSKCYIPLDGNGNIFITIKTHNSNIFKIKEKEALDKLNKDVDDDGYYSGDEDAAFSDSDENNYLFS